jgi:dGTP triphosphohydrolase
MEAADDIGYATGDIEDVLKKGFVDFEASMNV